MPAVLFSETELPVGRTIDSHEFCGANRAALAASDRDRIEVEAFLDEVRRESYPDLPERVCSILTIPWPRYAGEFRPRGAAAAVEREPLLPPPGGARFCYLVTPEKGARRLTADESWVDAMVEAWPEIRGEFDKWGMANAYWDGQIRDGVSLLLEGPFRVDEECAGAPTPSAIMGERAPRETPKARVPLRRAAASAERLRRLVDGAADWSLVVGSIRRKLPEVGDIDIVALVDVRDLPSFRDEMSHLGFSGGDRVRRGAFEGLPAQVWLAHRPEELGAMVFAFTGDKLFEIAMRRKALGWGLSVDQYGVWMRDTGELVFQSPHEEDFFSFLDVPYHAPEDRSLLRRGR